MQNESNQHPQPELNEVSAPQAEAPALETSQPDLGLAAAREAKRMSEGDAAYALKVGAKVIRALEAGDWAALPGRAFTVGILRAYGRLLDVPVDAIVAQVPGAQATVKKTAAQNAAARKAPAASRRDGESKRQEKRMLKSGLLMVALAVVLAYVVPTSWWSETFNHAEALIERVTGSTPAAGLVTEGTQPAALTQPVAENAVPVEMQAPTSPGTLELKFAAPAWVEVKDYTGRIIYSQLNPAGTTQFITGAAPLDVLIGNAKQVQARWRDEPVKLDKLTGDDVARQVLR
ncbi:MAG: helix-turn-helix domain-containing protein [Fluviibacter sp.]